MATIGTRFRFDGIDLQWTTRTQQQPASRGLTILFFFQEMDAAPSSPNFIAAPQNALTPRDATVATHQIWIRVPVR